jgi:hypothetical protein
MRCIISIFILVFTVLLWNDVYAATYYIDYDSGNDSLSGASEASAWKHSPGDPNAKNKPAACVFKPGDQILFKGGVAYRGSINIKAGGTEAAPIVFKGDGWGTGKAIIDGSEPITSVWTKCASQEEAGGNPHWQNIWHTLVPEVHSTFSANLCEGDDFLHVAHHPSPKDPFFNDNVSEYLQPTTITRTYLVDPLLAGLGAEQLAGKYVYTYQGNNHVESHLITGYMAAENKITFNDIGEDPYTGNQARYALANHVKLIDSCGEYVYDEKASTGTEHKVYLWPCNANPNQATITMSYRTQGIDVTGSTSLIVDGFRVQKYSGWAGGGTGLAIASYGDAGSTSIIFRNNLVEKNRFANYGGFGGIFLYASKNSLIENNLVRDCPNHRGIFCISTKNTIIRKNTVTKVGSTGISNYCCEYTQIYDNQVMECLGGHANGMSFYAVGADIQYILVARNRIDGDITFEGDNASGIWARHITIYGNLIDDLLVDMVGITNWGRNVQDIRVFNNTVVNTNHGGISVGYSVPLGEPIIIKNNITDGIYAPDTDKPPGERSHNLYVGVNSSQNQAGWKPATGEIINWTGSSYTAVDQAKVFMNHLSKDYRLKTGSQAINGGINLTLDTVLPKKDFPGFDWTLDINGNHWPAVPTWDMGAMVFSGISIEKADHLQAQSFSTHLIGTKIAISLDPKSFKHVAITLYNLSGKLIRSMTFTVTKDSYTIPITENISKGCYLTRIQAGNKHTEHKIITW